MVIYLNELNAAAVSSGGQQPIAEAWKVKLMANNFHLSTPLDQQQQTSRDLSQRFKLTANKLQFLESIVICHHHITHPQIPSVRNQIRDLHDLKYLTIFSRFVALTKFISYLQQIFYSKIYLDFFFVIFLFPINYYHFIQLFLRVFLKSKICRLPLG